MAQLPSSLVLRGGRSITKVAAAELPKYFTRDEVARLLSATTSERDRLLGEVMWQTGVRVSELLALTAGAIDWEAQVLRVVTLKRRGHVRTIPLRPDLLGKLARHVAEGGIGPDRRLFALTRQRVHQIVTAAARRAGLPADRAHPHTLRHSFAVACVLARVPVLVLNAWLGHASLEATLVYTRILCADSRAYIADVDFG
jgi:site-specific recombinase XerD